MFGRKKQASPPALPVAQTVPRGFQSSSAWLYGEVQSHAERALYASLRQSVPLIDAALGKIVRLIGSFRVVTEDSAAQAFADDLLENVRTNGGAAGLTAFVGGYLDDLLTYGEAIGEMLPDERLGGICALYNASLNDAAVAAGSSPLEPVVLADGKPVKNQSLMLVSLLNPESGSVLFHASHSGVWQAEILSAYLCDFLGIWRFPAAPTPPVRLTVPPVPTVPEPPPDFGLFRSVALRPRPGGGYSEIHELREYRPGDPLRTVHWKATAKTDSPVVREAQEALSCRALVTYTLSSDRSAADRIFDNLVWVPCGMI